MLDIKHYGKIFLTVLALGLGSYFHVDVGMALKAIASITESVPAPVAPAPVLVPDAGK